jgi:hypothetical protein
MGVLSSRINDSDWSWPKPEPRPEKSAVEYAQETSMADARLAAHRNGAPARAVTGPVRTVAEVVREEYRHAPGGAVTLPDASASIDPPSSASLASAGKGEYWRIQRYESTEIVQRWQPEGFFSAGWI